MSAEASERAERADQSITLYDLTLERIIEAWLHAKHRRTQSDATRNRYRLEMTKFRALLNSGGIDLDGDPALIATIAQGWASHGVKQQVGGASFNMRLGIISSFYRFVLRKGYPGFEHNPIDRVERAVVQLYASAQPIPYQVVKARLAGIDTSTLEGKRDKTLLMFALMTGRRLSEIAAMRRDHLSYEDVIITVTFPRTKGGKVIRDELTRSLSVMLADYLHAVDMSGLLRDPQAVWVAIGPHKRGQALHPRSLERICERHLGTEHFHALRHTFAHAMEEAGAKVSEIQARLQHGSLATTGRYLAQLSSDKNPYAGIVESFFTDE